MANQYQIEPRPDLLINNNLLSTAYPCNFPLSLLSAIAIKNSLVSRLEFGLCCGPEVPFVLVGRSVGEAETLFV